VYQVGPVSVIEKTRLGIPEYIPLPRPKRAVPDLVQKFGVQERDNDPAENDL
jgi:hypothetical protein